MPTYRTRIAHNVKIYGAIVNLGDTMNVYRLSKPLRIKTGGPAWRMEAVARGLGPMQGDMNWACGGCGALMFANFARLPFEGGRQMVLCGHCGVISEPLPPEESEVAPTMN